jgi:hypothetical protein
MPAGGAVHIARKGEVTHWDDCAPLDLGTFTFPVLGPGMGYGRALNRIEGKRNMERRSSESGGREDETDEA